MFNSNRLKVNDFKDIHQQGRQSCPENDVIWLLFPNRFCKTSLYRALIAQDFDRAARSDWTEDSGRRRGDALTIDKRV